MTLTYLLILQKTNVTKFYIDAIFTQVFPIVSMSTILKEHSCNNMVLHKLSCLYMKDCCFGCLLAVPLTDTRERCFIIDCQQTVCRAIS